MALMNSYDHILKIWDDFGKLSGRRYQPVESYRTKGAKILLLSMGSLSEVAEVAVDELRDAGVKVGLLKLRLWRPFPFAALREAAAGAELLIVCDRALSFGGAGGPVMAEVRSAFYPLASRPQIMGYIIGLGGRDVPPQAFKDVVVQAQAEAQKGPTQEFHIFGVRG
jgi:pyruvate ferredoxin oxidoreductase alpha subunit